MSKIDLDALERDVHTLAEIMLLGQEDAVCERITLKTVLQLITLARQRDALLEAATAVTTADGFERDVGSAVEALRAAIRACEGET